MTQAERILSAKNLRGLMPDCPQGKATDRAAQKSAALCWPPYAAVVAVEIHSSAEKLQAFVSWRVREDGSHVAHGDKFPNGGFSFARRASESESRLRGDELAIKFLTDGTVYKRIKGTLAHLWKIDPKLLKQLVEGSSNSTSVPAPAPALVVTPPTCPVVTPPPPAVIGNASHALLFAGLPYLEDDRSSGLSQGLFSTLDVLAVGGGLAALSWSVVRRNQYSDGDSGALGSANDYLKTSAWLLGGALAIRLGATACYWWDSCRGWTQK
jgi:hypothetical protein